MPLPLFPYLAPLALFAAAILALRTPGMRPGRVPKLAEAAGLCAVGIAVISAVALTVSGPATSPLLGASGIGFSVRLDAVSAVMLLLVSFVGWVVLRYAATYLDGDDRQGAFTGWLCATLSSVMLLVIAGNVLQLVLAWIATSLFLHRLLLH